MPFETSFVTPSITSDFMSVLPQSGSFKRADVSRAMASKCRSAATVWACEGAGGGCGACGAPGGPPWGMGGPPEPSGVCCRMSGGGGGVVPAERALGIVSLARQHRRRERLCRERHCDARICNGLNDGAPNKLAQAQAIAGGDFPSSFAKANGDGSG